MKIELKDIRKQIDELLSLNEDINRVGLITDSNGNWTGEWVITRNISTDGISYTPEIINGTQSTSLKELIDKWNIIHPKSHQLNNVDNAPEIKLVTTLKEIIEDAAQDSINNPCSFIAKLRLLKARNCRIMIEAGIDENTDYIKAKEMYFEKYPEKTLIKA